MVYSGAYAAQTWTLTEADRSTADWKPLKCGQWIWRKMEKIKSVGRTRRQMRKFYIQSNKIERF